MSVPSAIRSRALPRIAGASAALVAAVLVSRSVPDVTQFFNADCTTVSDWASNQDAICNTPLLNRLCLVVALVSIAAILVVDAFVGDAETAQAVRGVNLAVWAFAPVLALIAAEQAFSSSPRPTAGFALVVLAVTLVLLAIIPVSAAVPWRGRGPVLAIALVASAVLFAYSQMLWSGNGA